MGKLTLAAGYLEAAIIAIVCAILGQSEGRCCAVPSPLNVQLPETTLDD
jgi:hypothetical protein